MTQRQPMRAVVVIAATIISTLLFAVELSGSKTESFAAIFPPWWDSTRAFAAAGGVGDIVGVGMFPTVVIVHGNTGGLAMRLHAAGALIVVSAQLFNGCIQSNGGLR
jgi:hypothetical protein